MKLIPLIILFTQINTTPEECTKDAHMAVDNIFDIVQSFEKDPIHPDPQPMKDLLGSV